MRRAVMSVAVVVLLAAAGGCASGASVQERSDGVTPIVAGSSGSGMDSRVRGALAVLEGDCVGLDVEGTPYLVARPQGTSLSEDGEPTVEIQGPRLRTG